jgi:protein-S-isoprenylcysteine O-methyltransferase Ste14
LLLFGVVLTVQTPATQSYQFTQLQAINLAKIITILLLGSFAIAFGISGMRQIIYLCLHIGYCVWWLLEQWIYPERRRVIFNEPVNIMGILLAILFVGVFYALPGFLAFINPTPISLWAVAMGLPLYLFGSLINTSADVQKLTAKQQGVGLVRDGIWRFARHINYFGDLLRYLSFSVIAGSAWAYLVPAAIAITYWQRIQARERSLLEKYEEYPEYQQKSKQFIPFIW